MTKMSSAMFSVGTLLRHAEDKGAHVRVLVQGTWLEGRVLGCDGLGAILDDGQGEQALVRLDSVVAVTFVQAQMDEAADFSAPRAHGGHSGPFASGPVTVPSPSSGEYHFLTAKPY